MISTMNAPLTEKRGHTPRVRHATRMPEILIVDDDVDSALLVDMVFRHLGCQTTCSLNFHEARKKICSLKADIIILDWCLDHEVDAGRILRQCAQSISRFNPNTGTEHRSRPKIITYSSLHESEIEALDKRYFDHLDHWRKPIGHKEMLNRVLGVLKQVRL
jgi:CheY-like chemotaxis protein